MLCDPREDNVPYNPSCLTSFYDGDQNGETEIPNGNGIIDYIGITSETYDPFGEGNIQYIGVIRNNPADGTPLRCFTTARNPSVNCTSPPNGHVLGAPYIIYHLPIISWPSIQATENDPNLANRDAYPLHPVPNAIVPTLMTSDGTAPANFWNFTVNRYNGNCGQAFAFNTYSMGRIAYVTAVPFGGNIGTQDAVVIEGQSFIKNGISTLERYYYVKNLGRVRESHSVAPNISSTYGSDGSAGSAENLNRSSYRSLDNNVIYHNGNHGGCAQGSAVPIHT